MFTLKNKIVFITGASSGIGFACAHAFAQAGARLLLCARREAALETLSEALQKTYSVEVHTFPLDVTQPKDVTTSLAHLPDAWKKIDVLINNAGLAAGLDTIQDGQADDWEAMIDTNVKGLLYVTKAILPHMLTQKAGHIINIGSIAGHQVYAKGSVYCATKFAVKALTEGLRLDLSGSHIRVTSVDPGAVETAFSLIRFKGDAQRAAAVYEGMTPLRPEDIADAVLYCATRPPHVNVSQMIVMPTAQASVTTIAREHSKP